MDKIPRCNEESEKEINFLFKLMVGFFPSSNALISNQENFDFYKKTWIVGLNIAGIIKNCQLDMDLFTRGVKALPFFKSQYMPSLSQFVNMCFHGAEQCDS